MLENHIKRQQDTPESIRRNSWRSVCFVSRTELNGYITLKMGWNPFVISPCPLKYKIQANQLCSLVFSFWGKPRLYRLPFLFNLKSAMRQPAQVMHHPQEPVNVWQAMAQQTFCAELWTTVMVPLLCHSHFWSKAHSYNRQLKQLHIFVCVVL